ncbi:tubulin beta chain [Plakobranchus ocellatus]|uniref:Tubulin beta chain n=1 Tax=Plakobranchus ocellatus TaxID=259542 RepID=A0AAV4AJN8_9GAST|nr:tubulin beta chain [Plakobranchus ocellatus]
MPCLPRGEIHMGARMDQRSDGGSRFIGDGSGYVGGSSDGSDDVGVSGDVGGGDVGDSGVDGDDDEGDSDGNGDVNEDGGKGAVNPITKTLSDSQLSHPGKGPERTVSMNIKGNATQEA